MQGVNPAVQAAMELYNILGESGTNLCQPVGLENQLLKYERMDSDVGKSMLQLLQVLLLALSLPGPLLKAWVSKTCSRAPSLTTNAKRWLPCSGCPASDSSAVRCCLLYVGAAY